MGIILRPAALIITAIAAVAPAVSGGAALAATAGHPAWPAARLCVSATIPVGSDPFDVGVDPRTGMIYVGNAKSDTVSVINGHTNAVVATIPVGHDPAGVAVARDLNSDERAEGALVYSAISVADDGPVNVFGDDQGQRIAG